VFLTLYGQEYRKLLIQRDEEQELCVIHKLCRNGKARNSFSQYSRAGKRQAISLHLAVFSMPSWEQEGFFMEKQYGRT